MTRIFEFPVSVLLENIDNQGHINNIAYIQWLQEAAIQHSSENGWDWVVTKGSGWVGSQGNT